MKILLKWFKTNSITANPKNFQFMILNKSLRAPITPNINDIKIRVLKDNLIRAYHWESVEIQGSRRSWSSSSSCKLHALRRIKDTSCLIKQTSFSLSLQTASLKFKYASVIWMFGRETHYEKIQKIQNNVLKIVFSSHESYAKLKIHHIQNNDDTVHQKHLRNTGYGNLYSY